MHSDSLLLDLYACAAQPARWPHVLDHLCDETGACSAVVQAFSFEGVGVRMRWQAVDTRTARHHALHRAPDQHNPRLDRDRGLRGLNRVVRDDELFERDDPAREALRGQLASLGLGHFMGTLQALPGDIYLGIALHRPVDDPHDFGAAPARRLATLAPHFGQACELGAELRAAALGATLLRRHLDALRCGLVVCDADARVQWMNRSAQALVRGPGELQLQGQTLRARQPAGSCALHAEIAAAAQTSDACTVPRFVALGQGDTALHLALRACGRGADASVLLAVTRTHDATDVPADAWSRLLGVTPAEAGLVATLAAGGTLEQHAERRGVSLGTVRGQLKQVLAKTGTNRQAELVRLALSSAAAHVLASVSDAGV